MGGHEVGGPGRVGEAELHLEALLGHAQPAKLPRRLRRDPDLGRAAEREPAPADGLGDASDGERPPLDRHRVPGAGAQGRREPALEHDPAALAEPAATGHQRLVHVVGTGVADLGGEVLGPAADLDRPVQVAPGAADRRHPGRAGELGGTPAQLGDEGAVPRLVGRVVDGEADVEAVGRPPGAVPRLVGAPVEGHRHAQHARRDREREQEQQGLSGPAAQVPRGEANRQPQRAHQRSPPRSARLARSPATEVPAPSRVWATIAPSRMVSSRSAVLATRASWVTISSA